MRIFSLAKLLPLGLLWLAATAYAGPSGKEFYEELIKTTPVYEEPTLNAYVRELGERIVAQTEMAGETFTFTIMDSPVLNAFATRGNYVYINRGMLNYISNEAQLVSVMAHEIAHITRGHVDGQEAKQFGTEAVAIIAAILAGSGQVYEATRELGGSVVQSHGRNNELEADQYGAVYMAKLGYDTDEMLAMLAILKDKEMLDKSRAANGGTRPSYHGLFSTHPRSDARLRSAVTRANSQNGGGRLDSGEDKYRSLTHGLIWGENFLAKEANPQRYSNMTQRVRLDFPEGWQQETLAGGVKGGSAGGEASLSMMVRSRSAQSPEEFLYNHLKIASLQDGKALAPASLAGYTGILPGTDGAPDQRIAVVYYKFDAYIFTGEVKNQAEFAEADRKFLAAINSFRPISRREVDGQKPKRVYYVKATAATTFEAIGRELNLSATDIEDLRLINGFYPQGEPSAGQWIKIFRQ